MADEETGQLHVEITNPSETADDLCRLYWTLASNGTFLHSVKSVAAQFNMSANRVGSIVEANCYAWTSIQVCSRCGNPLKFRNRSAYQQAVRYAYQKWTCAKCRQEIYEEQQRRQAEQIEQRTKAVQEHYQIRAEHVYVHELSLDDAVYLLSFMRALGSESFSVFGPMTLATLPLAPTKPYCWEILKQLFHNKLIQVHPESNLDAFDFRDSVPESFYLEKVRYALAVGDDPQQVKGLVATLELKFRNQAWPSDWESRTRPLWKRVALHECVEFLELKMVEHNFEPKFGERTITVLDSALDRFSVSQIYTFIWRAAKDAAAFLVAKRVTKPHAANTVPGAIQRMAEKAYAEGWPINGYRRDRQCPQSALSQVLFNAVLRIGDKGFEEAPRTISPADKW